MKDFSDINIEKAWKEISDMQKNSHFSEEDKDKFRCKCRFEKTGEKSPPPQNGNHFQKISSSVDEDKLLILALILILSKNCNDKFLLMALLYIIM